MNPFAMFHVERVTCGSCVPLHLFHVEHARRKISQRCFTWNVVTSLTIFNKEISKNTCKFQK